jgi:hypothetical protein
LRQSHKGAGCHTRRWLPLNHFACLSKTDARTAARSRHRLDTRVHNRSPTRLATRTIDHTAKKGAADRPNVPAAAPQMETEQIVSPITTDYWPTLSWLKLSPSWIPPSCSNVSGSIW